jgi:hypothetical protein
MTFLPFMLPTLKEKHEEGDSMSCWKGVGSSNVFPYILGAV